MGNEFDSGQGDNAGQEDEYMAKKPQNKGFKETSKRLRQGKESRLSHRASLDWRHDSARVCDADAGQGAYTAPTIDELKAVILKSRTGAALLEGPEAAAVEIRFDMQSPGAQYYPNKDKPVITLNPHRTRGDLLNMLARELRRAWQHRHGALVNPLSYEPDEAILVNRAQAADALMINVRIAWELKLVGEQEAWNHLAGSPMADVGRAFEVRAQKDFRTLNNGEAARTAYDKFFEDSRTKAYDKRLIHQMLLDESGYMRRSGKGPRAGMELFQRLGEVPAGRNYLALKSARAPTDAGYAVVEDRSNANFLWFIKFERSFHEKEMQMVKESVKLSAEIVDFAKWSLRTRADDGGKGL